MASTLQNTIMAGESEENNLKNTFTRGGWKKNSRVSDIHYNMNKSTFASNKAARSGNIVSTLPTQVMDQQELE